MHTNHLNKALEEITGKTTTEHIADKLLAEARALPRHSNWSLVAGGPARREPHLLGRGDWC